MCIACKAGMGRGKILLELRHISDHLLAVSGTTPFGIADSLLNQAVVIRHYWLLALFHFPAFSITFFHYAQDCFQQKQLVQRLSHSNGDSCLTLCF
jgi:hypothetical protein